MLHYSNCTLASLNGIKYGFGAIGITRTYKTRLTRANAEMFMQNIHSSHHELFNFYHTKKGHVILALVCHYGHQVWEELYYAQAVLAKIALKAKADKKIAIANKKLAEANAILNCINPPLY